MNHLFEMYESESDTTSESNNNNIYIEELDSFPVIYIEEIDEVKNEKKIFDNKMFVYYVAKTGYFYITGKRRDTKKIVSIPYSFICKKSKEVLNFIDMMVALNNYNLVMYNYTNMPLDNLANATYDFMINNIDERYEMFGYDNINFKNLKLVKKAIQICRHVHNYISDDEEESDDTNDE